MPDQHHRYTKSFLLPFSLIGVVLAIGCSEPDSPADQLLTEAAALISSAQTAQQTSFSEALRLYQAALAKAQTARPYLSTAQEEKSDFAIGSITFKVLKDTRIPQTTVRAQAEKSPLACALLVARTIPEVQPRAAVLEQITLAYLKAGQYEQALQATQFVPDVHRQTDLLKQIALGNIRAGDYEQGFQLAQRIARLTDQALFGVEVLTQIALQCVKAGQYEYALQVAQTTPRPSSRAWIMTEIAGTQEQKDFTARAFSTLSQATDIATTIPNDSLKSLVQGQIGQTYARLGDYFQALEVAQTIWEVRHRIDTIVAIVHTAIEAGDLDNAQQLVQMLTNGEETLPKSQLFTIQALIEIAEKYMAAGHKEQASSLLSTTLGSLTALTEYMPQPAHPELVSRLALAFLEVGKTPQAYQLTDMITVPGRRAEALMQLAFRHADMGEIDPALQIAATLADPPRQAEIYRHLALTFLEQDNTEQALKLAQAIPLPEQQATTLLRIALSHAEAGRTDRAIHIAALLAEPSQQAKVFGRLAQTYLEQGNVKQAHKLAQAIKILDQKTQTLVHLAYRHTQDGEIDHAMQIAGMLPKQRQAEVFGHIAQTYLKQGDVEQALNLAQDIQVPEQRTQTMIQLARRLAETGNGGQALQLANDIELPQAREAALLAVAAAHIQAARYPEALEAMQAAPDTPAKANLLARVATAYAKYAKRQEAEKASGLFAQALTIAQTRRSPQARAQTLVSVGSWHLQTEQKIPEESKEILHDIIAELGDRPMPE